MSKSTAKSVATRVIKSVEIGPMPKTIFDQMPNVVATYDDGTTEKLFSFYPDEISFSPVEFAGKTRAEAMRLRHQKDVQFLQSR
jgi:hypothetical protein